MSNRFRGKFKIDSARLYAWDYGWKGSYFVTICTFDRQPLFGEIDNGVMQLSELGNVANRYWYEIPKHAKDVRLDAFVVMPNHIHGIITLLKDHGFSASKPPAVETGHALSLQQEENILPGQLRLRNPGRNTISSIVGGYKSAVTRQVRQLGFDFGWQPRFHDHIIRDLESYQKISEYINPSKWKEDRFYVV